MRYKYLLPFLILGVALFSGCTEDDNPPPTSQDYPPYPPSVFTAFALSDTSIYLQWHDNAQDELGFLLYRATTGDFSLLDTLAENSVSYLDTGLQELTTYYYYIQSFNEYGNSVILDTIHTTTRSSNSPPDMPTEPVPADSAINISMVPELSWTADDPDPDDTLSFDLYLGTENDNPLPLLAEDLMSAAFTPDSLSPGTLYLWKIVAFDVRGDSTFGPTWRFTTELPPAQE